jgi:cellulose biosynthesis protein BcsQ
MKKVHMVLQGKGGVGKSLVSALYAQYKYDQDQPALCIDTDPVNATFSSYTRFNVQKIDIMDGDEINPRHFDRMMQLIIESDTDVIIDNGAATFVPLSSYMISNDAPNLLASMDIELVIHTVITGGQALIDTLHGFDSLATQFPDPAKFVVWLNPFHGRVENGGKRFEQLKAYTNNKGRVSAIIELPELRKELSGKDFGDMLSARQTFDEALKSDLPIMERQRLSIVKKNIYAAILATSVL